MCDAPWVQVCNIFPRISSNIFCYISHFLQSNSNSPVKTRISKFSTRNPRCGLLALRHVCWEKYKILQSIRNSPIKSRISKFSRRTAFPRSPPCPQILDRNVKKGLLRNKPISKDHTLYIITPFYGLWSLGCHAYSRGID